MSETAVTVFKPDELNLITSTIAKGANKEELDLFLYVAGKRGLNPLTRQIHFVKRGDQGTIQTGIDGFRLIAQRTGQYAPSGKPTQYEVSPKGNLISATVYGNKILNGTAFEFSATAYFDEYAPKMPNGKLFPMWEKMPRTMLEKCAEAKLLRKGFPEELSGLYADEEMHQADAQIKIIEADNSGATDKVKDIPEPEKVNVVICPKHGVEMRKTKWGDYSHIIDDEKTPDGKAVWCNIKAKDLVNPPTPTKDTDTPEKNAVEASQEEINQTDDKPPADKDFKATVIDLLNQLEWSGTKFNKWLQDTYKFSDSRSITVGKRQEIINKLQEMISLK